MATYTENLNLKKPAILDPASIGDINSNMDIIDEAMTDYIVEQGRSGAWVYRKWSSGIAECWTSENLATGTLTMTQISSSGIYHSANLEVGLPSGLFVARPQAVNFSIDSTSYVLSIQYLSASDKNKIVYCVLKGGGSTSGVSYTARAIGRWK